jgi:hypothetical protein
MYILRKYTNTGKQCNVQDIISQENTQKEPSWLPKETHCFLLHADAIYFVINHLNALASFRRNIPPSDRSLAGRLLIQLFLRGPSLLLLLLLLHFTSPLGCCAKNVSGSNRLIC